MDTSPRMAARGSTCCNSRNTGTEATKMPTLKLFNASAKCPKCAHPKISTRHEGHIDQDPCWYDRKYHPVGKWPEHEYMHRTCERCGYDWPEAVLAPAEEITN
jgi:Zn ribbon nucleic-acid-binding protein